jgi:hypothetical protein
MDNETSNGDDAAKGPQPKPQPILHANQGTVATAHPASIRKRSAAVVLIAVTLGVGATAYAAAVQGRNCQSDPKDPNQSANCSGSGAHSSYAGLGSFNNSTSHTQTPSATSTADRGGFGSTGYGRTGS